LKRNIITTADGSKTIQLEDWNEQYHSVHGAVQEAYHVFIKHGLQYFDAGDLAVLEIGFGTGLNAFITFLEAEKRALSVAYHAVEFFPVTLQEVKALDYVANLDAMQFEHAYLKMHQAPWGRVTAISDFFELTKQKIRFESITVHDLFNVIYFDAFGPRVQPELWTVAIFARMYAALKPGGILVTYSAKGSVRRAMQAVGFTVERLPGPPGKREMLRAIK